MRDAIGSLNSAQEFHAPQVPHWPCHLEKLSPQSVHTKDILFFAILLLQVDLYHYNLHYKANHQTHSSIGKHLCSEIRSQ